LAASAPVFLPLTLADLADLAGDFFTAWRERLERDLTMDIHSIEPGNESIVTTG
jgi:hypothetical protein